jgi:hypothetical protein
MVARSKGAVASTQSMLSRKKGRRYGESHQKALQISVGMLPLVGVSRREGATFLPGFRTKRKAWHLCMNAFAALGWESAPLPTRRWCRKGCDGLSGHKAAEISSSTLLLRWRLGRWRSPSRLSIAPCGVDAYTRCTQSHSRLCRRPPSRVAVARLIRLPLLRSVRSVDHDLSSPLTLHGSGA